MPNDRRPRSAGPSHSTVSPWQDFRPAARAPLEEDLRADVCVIGAGYAGLSAAYFLVKAGRSVVLLEARGVGDGESSATTAHLSPVLDERWSELERRHGAETCALVREAHAWAVDRMETLCAEERIDCGFARVDGWLFRAPGSPERELDDELAAARRCGLDVAEAARAPIPGFDSGRALRFPRQARHHPLKYLDGLAAAIERLGGRVFGGTEAVSAGEGFVETRSGRRVSAPAVVVATNVPFNDRVVLHTRLFPYRTYVLAARAAGVPDGLFWDTAEPYHYVRRHEDMLIVGGEDHKTGQAADQESRFRRLESWARERFPGLGEVEYRWSGQIINTSDGLGFAGRNPGDENVYVIAGDCGNGTTHGTLGGRVVADLILGVPGPWAEVFSPSRNPARGAREWVKENLNVAARYRDYLTRGDVASIDEIAPGHGAVLRRGAGKVAVYKDESGELTELSAICPHLGGVVCWNPGEKSWDCPLHGSRFSPTGEVLNGPANSGLPPVPEKGPRRRGRGASRRASS